MKTFISIHKLYLALEDLDYCGGLEVSILNWIKIFDLKIHLEKR